MDERLVKLKAVLDERERVYARIVQDYEHYKRNPPGTPDGNIVALETNVHDLFSTVQDLMDGYRTYMSALEEALRGSQPRKTA